MSKIKDHFHDKICDMESKRVTSEQARYYIDTFSKYTLEGTNNVIFGDGETIFFNNMTDEQAIRVAKGLMDIEACAAKGAIKQ